MMGFVTDDQIRLEILGQPLEALSPQGLNRGHNDLGQPSEALRGFLDFAVLPRVYLKLQFGLLYQLLPMGQPQDSPPWVDFLEEARDTACCGDGLAHAHGQRNQRFHFGAGPPLLELLHALQLVIPGLQFLAGCRVAHIHYQSRSSPKSGTSWVPAHPGTPPGAATDFFWVVSCVNPQSAYFPTHFGCSLQYS